MNTERVYNYSDPEILNSILNRELACSSPSICIPAFLLHPLMFLCAPPSIHDPGLDLHPKLSAETMLMAAAWQEALLSESLRVPQLPDKAWWATSNALGIHAFPPLLGVHFNFCIFKKSIPQTVCPA